MLPRIRRAQLQPWLQNLHNASRHIARATVLCGLSEVCIGIACSHEQTDRAATIDDHCLAADTASGRVILAHSAPSLWVRAAGHHGTRTNETAATAANLYQELANVRRTGWAFSHDLTTRPMTTIAAPVLGADGEAIAALAITGRLSNREYGSLASVVLPIAHEASQRIADDTRCSDSVRR